MAELTVRLVFSLAVVVGLLLLTVKMGGRRFRSRSGAVVRVVHRQPLSRSSAVAVVEVGSRVLVLGTTEHQINVLAELDEGDLDTGEVIELDTLAAARVDRDATVRVTAAEAPAEVLAAMSPEPDAPSVPYAGAGKRRRPGTHAARPSTRTAEQVRPAAEGALVGSILSPQTWRQALAAASGRAS
jgi:flagellar protein FliO/FliZ